MKRNLLALLSLVAVATLAGCALFYPHANDGVTPADSMSPTPTDSASASPSPTVSESPTPTKQVAKPRLMYFEIDAAAQVLLLIGEVSNVTENGGYCTLTFYSGNTPLAQEKVQAEENVSTTQCYPARIPLSKLPKGTGQVVVSYESEGWAGSSDKTEVIIP